MFVKSWFAVVPTFKESIYKAQISTFFRIMSSQRRTHVKKYSFEKRVPTFLELTVNSQICSSSYILLKTLR
ncbi:hypothetical protein GS518_02295 [Leptospira interrogans]|nr:hypothetical protein A6J42_21085 [Leptospira interrogans serovar Copenhageni]QHH27245.1 hypothetical protein GS520_02290 [Leptospira interrogans]QOI45693.1 hypothetical protein Lepto898_02405 [Leptospira interrogans serovar Icterohaemorrhagiae]KAA5550720.1 hypothetical protein F3G11_10995 [Leptospira interrogans serovar Copenhageni]MTY94443.1 hypothetical protein [Leptospira interrogans serovar Copenhageni]